MIHKFKGGKDYEVLSELFDITPHTNYLEFILNGNLYYYEFNNDHTIKEKIIYKLIHFASVRDTGESIQGTYQDLKS